MAFRSHLGRSLDLRLRSNQAMVGLVAIASLVALVLWLGGESATLFLAPAHVFATWALVREIDPDHQWTALVAAASAGAWVLAGLPVLSILPLGGLVGASRLISATTGRRPLIGDLVVMTIGGIAIGFTVAGWIAGFGIALALYLDDRRTPASRGVQVAAATVTAIGTTVLASAVEAFPKTLPEIIAWIVIVAGGLAVALVAREPPIPVSRVDARYAAPLDHDRLHVSRAVTGMLAFAMSVFTGTEALGLSPLLVALALVLVSGEMTRRRR